MNHCRNYSLKLLFSSYYAVVVALPMSFSIILETNSNEERGHSDKYLKSLERHSEFVGYRIAAIDLSQSMMSTRNGSMVNSVRDGVLTGACKFVADISLTISSRVLLIIITR